MRRSVLGFGTTVLVAGMLAAPALAQSDPSTLQIINALKPTGQVSGANRGIEPVPSGSMPPAASPAAGIAAPIAQTSLNIVFATGSADLTPQATAELDRLGQALTSSTLSSYRFEIIGHTDTTGSTALNQALSAQRAQTAKSYLETKFGIPDARLQAVGVGETGLLVPTPPQTAELRNRRVQIVNLGQ
jgi:outer membrane protein OmpA-like peptidoglycan-associated protein